MKKIIALLLALAMVFSLAACGDKESAEPASDKLDPNTIDLVQAAKDAGGEFNIQIWGKDSIGDNETSRGYLLDVMAKEYTEKFENVKFEYVYQGGYDDLRAKVTAASAAGDLPHLFMVEESVVKSFEAIAANIYDYVPEAITSDYMEGLLPSMIVDGKLLGAPFARSLPVLNVNDQMLEAAGWKIEDINTNDDMFECAKDIYKATGKPGLAVWWDSDLWHWESAIYADGGQVLTDDGSAPAFGKAYDYVGAKYLKKIQEGLIEGYVGSFYTAPKVDDEVSSQLCTGGIGMLLYSCNSMPKRMKAAAENGYTLSTRVQPAGEGGVHITGGGSNWILSNTHSELEKMLAGGFLAYIESTEQVLRITEGTGSLMITESARNSAAGQKLLADTPQFKATYDSIPYLHERPNTGYWAEMYTYGVDKLAQMALHPEEADCEAIIDDLEAKFQQIINDNAY